MYASIDLGDPAKERAAFFGALDQLGGLGGLEFAMVSTNPAASPYPPKKDVDFDDSKGGGWRYRAKTDGTFLIIGTPEGSKARGKTFRPDGTKDEKKTFEAIKAEYLKYAATQTEARSAKKAASASRTADTLTALFKGIGEAAPGVISRVEAVTAEAAEKSAAPPPEEKKGWGALEYGLLAGGVVVTGVVGFLIYRSFSAPAGKSE